MRSRTAGRRGPVAGWFAVAAATLMLLALLPPVLGAGEGRPRIRAQPDASGGGPTEMTTVPVRTPDPKVPGVPTNVTAIPGNRTVLVQWSPPENASPRVTGYNASLGTTYQGPWIDLVSTAGTNASFAGLTNGQAYYVVITASNPNGSGAGSLPVEVVPAGVPYPPGPPRLQWLTSASVNVTWGPPAQDQGAAVVNYTVLFALNSSHSTGVGAWSQVSVGTALSYRINGIVAGSNVSVRIQAWNTIGGSALSPPAVSQSPATSASPGESGASGATLGIAVLLVVIVLVVLATIALAVRGREKRDGLGMTGPHPEDEPHGAGREPEPPRSPTR